MLEMKHASPCSGLCSCRPRSCSLPGLCSCRPRSCSLPGPCGSRPQHRPLPEWRGPPQHRSSPRLPHQTRRDHRVSRARCKLCAHQKRPALPARRTGRTRCRMPRRSQSDVPDRTTLPAESHRHTAPSRLHAPKTPHSAAVGLFARNAEEGDHAERIDVAPHARLPKAILLRRSIRSRAKPNGIRSCSLAIPPRNTEVDERRGNP